MGNALASQIETFPFFEELMKTPFLKELQGEKFSTALQEVLIVQTLRTGEVLLQEGQDNHSLYFLVDGRLRVSVKNELVATISMPGEILGELSVISPTSVSATVVSEVSSVVAILDLAKIKSEHPELMEAIEATKYKLFATVLANRLVQTNEKARLFEETNRLLVETQESLKKMNIELEKRVAERTKELAEKNASLEHAVVENKQLVRVLCHDLNNTLSVIQSTAEIAASERPRTVEQEKNFWKRIQRASSKERDIITYVKDCIAVESGKVQLPLSPVLLAEVIDSAEFLFQQRLEEKNLKLDVQIPSDLRVMAEPVSLANSVINNLISNAIKFSPRGERIFIRIENSDSDYVTLSVRDRGIGMPAHLMQDIFSMVKKSSRPGTGGELGTGFGMPLVKGHVEAYGGSIKILSYEKNDPDGHPSGTTCLLTFRVGTRS